MLSFSAWECHPDIRFGISKRWGGKDDPTKIKHMLWELLKFFEHEKGCPKLKHLIMETKQNSCSFSLDLGVVNKGFVKFIIAARAPRFENYLVWKKSISGFKFHLKNHHAFLITAICMSVPPFRPSISRWIFNDLCCTGSYSTAIHVTDTSIRASSLVLTHFSFRSERQKNNELIFFYTV